MHILRPHRTDLDRPLCHNCALHARTCCKHVKDKQIHVLMEHKVSNDGSY